jgi:poly-gamma-glutamate capsule biosynthesis protein CapA/YwtB (metallophosphatase superfamily)
VTARIIAAAAALLLVAAATPAGPAEAAEAPTHVSIDWVGDIALSAREGLPPHGGRGVFAGVRGILRAADIATGNLEGTLGRGGTTKCRGDCFAFQAPPRYAGLLARAGFDLMNLANNHSHDAGGRGLRQTVTALNHARIAHTGLGRRVTVEQVRGVKVAFVGFAPYPWTSPLTDIHAARRLVKRAARRAPIVVVDFHAGAEGAGATHTPHGTESAFGENRGNPRRFAHAVVDAGADAVLGSGPHVLRGIECYRRALIAYSLGNFVSYRTLGTGGVLGLSGILQVRLALDGRFDGGRLWPVRVHAPGIPRLDPSRASISLVRRLSRQDFGRRACHVTAGGQIRARR